MSGFKNARQITEFKRGMRIKVAQDWRTVVYIEQHGARLDNGDFVGKSCIGYWTLDLNSVWEGQVRRGGDSMATVKAIADSIDLMVYWVDGQGPYNDTKGGFVKNYPHFVNYPHVVWPEKPKTLAEIAHDLARNLQYKVNLETTARYIEKKLRGYGVTVQGQDNE